MTVRSHFQSSKAGFMSSGMAAVSLFACPLSFQTITKDW